MSFKNLKKLDLTGVLPQDIKDSLVCFTFVNSKVIKLDEAPDIATCNTNGYMYELKNKRILRSLNLEDNPSSVTCYYLPEGKKLVIFYLVFTTSNRLLIIRKTNKRLKAVQAYNDVKGFKVYDFKCLGFPQIKIISLNKPESFICEFPVERQINENSGEFKNTLPECLIEELEDLNEHLDVLTEEYNHLKKICSFNNTQTDIMKVPVSSSNFSSFFNNLTENKMKVHSKWFKVYGSNLILGLTLSNICNEIIDGLEIIIKHEKVKDYAFSFFQSFYDISGYLFSPRRKVGSVKPGEKIYAVGSFEVPEFYTESDLSISCCVTSKNLKDCLIKETFEINVCEIALETTVDLEELFTVEVLLAILIAKSETRLKIQTENVEDSLMESLLTKNLGFKSIRNVKDKLFYCTSTYLKEVFVALQHIAVNPTIWKMFLYTSEERQIYFLVNALYDLLPDNTAILCDESTN